MILDAFNRFSDEQAITASAASTDIIDLGARSNQFVATENTPRLGSGKPLYIHLNVDVAFTDAGSDSTVTVGLEEDDVEGFGTPAAVQTLFTIPALAAAGSRYYALIQPGVQVERYIRLFYTVAGGNLTTGSVSAHIAETIQDEAVYLNNSEIFG